MYALITPAYNEGKYLEQTIRSVLAQTVLPLRWVIVSDGSTDDTDQIASRYASEHDFIVYLRLERDKSGGNFASKVFAFNSGRDLLEGLPYSFIGNVDADVTVEPRYFECILEEFRRNPVLGVASGQIYEMTNGRLHPLGFDDSHYISGRAQLFRRQCFEAIGGYLPVSTGGEDTIATVMARMRGWECRTCQGLMVLHHKKSARARGFWKESFRDGAKDYGLGSHPVFQLAKSLNRLRQRPYVVAALVRGTGYLWQYCKPVRRIVDEDFIRFFRSEQWDKLKSRWLR
ncbi:MAG TPA: glycosyltransferase family A protein [Geomonas sp.]|nr:glycosyltransferase family A protein [Geomonas sp.]